MNEENIRLTYLSGKLPHGFCKGKTLNISNGSPNFSNQYINAFSSRVYPVLDLVRDMGNHLHGFAEIISPSFLPDHRFINLSTGEVIETAQFTRGKSFIMSKIQIGFCTIIQNIDFAVLEGAHRPGIDI